VTRVLVVGGGADAAAAAAAVRAAGHQVVHVEDATASEKELARAERTAAVRARLVSIAVHDLRNPLASILGNAEYLGQARELSPDSREAVSDLLASAKLFAQILAELRAVSRGLDGEIVTTVAVADAAVLVREVVRGAQSRAEHAGLLLSVDSDPTVPVRADRELLRHVVDDLIDNAVRNAPSRSLVTVEARKRGDTAIIEVSDQRAVPAALELLFDAEGGDAASGRRLALIFCRFACEAMGAKVWAEAGAAGGLKLSVELPAAG
jgi:two-component system sensor histidine kinase KdpD